jgi:hypothetical protein
MLSQHFMQLQAETRKHKLNTEASAEIILNITNLGYIYVQVLFHVPWSMVSYEGTLNISWILIGQPRYPLWGNHILSRLHLQYCYKSQANIPFIQ